MSPKLDKDHVCDVCGKVGDLFFYRERNAKQEIYVCSDCEKEIREQEEDLEDDEAEEQEQVLLQRSYGH